MLKSLFVYDLLVGCKEKSPRINPVVGQSAEPVGFSICK